MNRKIEKQIIREFAKLPVTALAERVQTDCTVKDKGSELQQLIELQKAAIEWANVDDFPDQDYLDAAIRLTVSEAFVPAIEFGQLSIHDVEDRVSHVGIRCLALYPVKALDSLYVATKEEPF